jgi:hypothetical protein
MKPCKDRRHECHKKTLDKGRSARQQERTPTSRGCSNGLVPNAIAYLYRAIPR